MTTVFYLWLTFPPITFIIMFIAAFLTGSLAVRLKNQAKKSEEAALLAQKEQLRANLLRSISHDLRTPLTAISGNASNLLSNGEKFDAETKHQLYLDIYENALWLINIVENLLAVTKIEKGKMTLKCSTELMEEIVRTHFPSIEENLLKNAMDVFYWIRGIRDIRKKPSTSELIDWVNALQLGGIPTDTLREKLPFVGVIVKKDEDLETVRNHV